MILSKTHREYIVTVIEYNNITRTLYELREEHKRYCDDSHTVPPKASLEDVMFTEEMIVVFQNKRRATEKKLNKLRKQLEKEVYSNEN